MKIWVKGLLAAFIGGAATSITVAIVDPLHFTAEVVGLKKLAIIVAVSGVLNAAFYLKKSPMPNGGDYVTPPR